MLQIIFILLVFGQLNCYQDEELFSLDLSNGLSQFTDFNDIPSTAEIADDSNLQVIKFSSQTHYGGIISEPIRSTSNNFWVVIEFKGEANCSTGAYIGYVRSDEQNVQRTLGLDYPSNMELFQLFRFESNGGWNTYKAYLPFAGVTDPEFSIQLILEKGNYFGVENAEAMFKGLKVYDFTFEDECPGTDKQDKLHYFEFLFSNNDLESKIIVDDSLLEESNTTHGKLRFDFPNSDVPCIKYALYALDADSQVIEAFNPTYTRNQYNLNELDFIDSYTYVFALTDIEALNCSSQTNECNVNGQLGNCTKYKCPIQFHVYFDNGDSFATKQEQFDYTKNNSQAIFNSYFGVVASKQTATIFNTLVKTKEIDAFCTGVCQINLNVVLALKFKLSEGDEYQAFDSTPVSLVWGDYVYFEITSTPDAYELNLFKIIVDTDDGSETLGKRYIASYIEAQSSQTGRLTFKMKIAGEAGLTEGKPFDLQFFTETILPNDRLLQTSADSLPKVQKTSYTAFVPSSTITPTPSIPITPTPNDNDDDKEVNSTDSNETGNITDIDSATKLFIASLLLIFIVCFL